MSDESPKCDKCGAPIETGLMAVFCPYAEQCEFWVPEEAETIRQMREGNECGKA